MVLGALFLLNLLLRVFYLRYDFLNGDETVRALNAATMLDGGTLYVDAVTDKPPGATLFYALVFSICGRSMKAVHLAAWTWSFLTAAVIYVISARLISRRVGILAASLFVYFSSNYLTQDMMAANTELLMALPYSVAFYLFVLAHQNPPGVGLENSQLEAVRRYWLSFGSGLMAGLAVIFKQVGVFIVLFFAAHALISTYRAMRNRGERVAAGRLLLGVYSRLAPVSVGLAFALGMLLIWLKVTGALQGFWRNAVMMGAAYVGSLPAGSWLKFMVGRVGGYVIFNGALWGLAAWATAYWSKNADRREIGRVASHDLYLAALLWGAASMVGVFAGGRFFGHYFFAVLPALSLLGGVGLELLIKRFSRPDRSKKLWLAVAGLIVLFVVGLYRFHHRTAILAFETVTGARTRFSAGWGMTRREREAEEVAQFVRERIGPGEPLYIWGFSLDVYWRSGCKPASRFLTPNYVAGQFYPEVSGRSEVAEQPFWREAREQLLDDLSASRPRLILNTDESLYDLPFPEITEFIRRNYVYEGQIGSDPTRPFLVFRLKEKDKRLKQASGPSANR